MSSQRRKERQEFESRRHKGVRMKVQVSSALPRYLPGFLFLCLFASLRFCGSMTVSHRAQTPPEHSSIASLAPTAEPLRAIVKRLSLPLPLPDGRILILKSQRRLELYNGHSLIKSYTVALGANPDGPKERQGDGRTPEGHFYICERNASNSAFHIFLGLSYPAAPDAAQAVNQHLISWPEYKAITRQLASRGTPPWETRLGGWVGIHGGTGDAFATKRAFQRGRPDWTAGCIGLRDSEIEEISAATKVGSPVTIIP